MADETKDTPRIESLRQKLKTDPDSRAFYQLGEELRKAGRFEEAEEVLRSGLDKTPGYLSAWVSLGRVLSESGRYDDAVEVLGEGLVLDPQNVVTARLLAECHWERKDPVEAIKKYKLVRALLPTDEEVVDRIELLERIIAGEESDEVMGSAQAGETEPREEQQISAASPPEAEQAEEIEPASEPDSPDLEPTSTAEGERDESASASQAIEFGAPDESLEPPVDQSDPDFGETGFSMDEAESEEGAGESPASELAPDESSEQEAAPADSADLFEASHDTAREGEETSPDPLPAVADPSSASDPEIDEPTVTMGNLYLEQGHLDQASRIYEKVLEREPENHEAKARLDELRGVAEPPADTPAVRKVRALENWLGKVGRS